MADNCGNSTNLIRKRTMKKSELKNIIKECVKEVIFEEGVLSGIITEVVGGLQTTSVVQESRRPRLDQGSQTIIKDDDAQKQVMSAIAGDAYAEAKKKFANPALFEGTKPVSDGTNRGALAGSDPHDPGVDISNIPGFGKWGTVASNIRK